MLLRDYNHCANGSLIARLVAWSDRVAYCRRLRVRIVWDDVASDGTRHRLQTRFHLLLLV